MSKPENQRNKATNYLVSALERMAFYDQRMVAVADQLFPRLPKGAAVAHVISALFCSIPEEIAYAAATSAAQRIINKSEHCPTLAATRRFLAEAVLAQYEQNFERLADYAGRFVALPPDDPKVAGEWLNRVVYSAVRVLGRETFTSTELTQWKDVVTDVIFGDLPMLTYAPVPKKVVAKTMHDFKSLMPRKNDQSQQ